MTGAFETLLPERQTEDKAHFCQASLKRARPRSRGVDSLKQIRYRSGTGVTGRASTSEQRFLGRKGRVPGAEDAGSFGEEQSLGQGFGPVQQPPVRPGPQATVSYNRAGVQDPGKAG